jgi:hypothetical protein
MTSSLAISLSVKPPKEMQYFFDEAPLIGNEKYEEFEELFVAIANAMKPTDTGSGMFPANRRRSHEVTSFRARDSKLPYSARAPP